MRLGAFLRGLAPSLAGGEQGRAYFFRSEEYPTLFFYLLLEYIRRFASISSVPASSLGDFPAQQGFGPEVLFCGDISCLNIDERKKFYSSIQAVLPRIVILAQCSPDTVLPPFAQVITIEKVVGMAEVHAVADIIALPGEQPQALLRGSILKYVGKLSLDRTCLLLCYATVLGSTRERFFTQWFEGIADADVSLFALSGSLFAFEKSMFLKQWQLLQDEYPIQFWIIFWEEQLWRAYYVFHFLSGGNGDAAKKMSARLPFNYIRSSWRKHDPVQLQRAHTFLCELDWRYKNGVSEGHLDLFYWKFFKSSF